MITKRVLTTLCLILAVGFLCSCATKKYVQQQVGTTRTELGNKLDEEAKARAELGNQVGELSALNKRNTARIEEVNTNLNSSVKSLDPKIEDAKRTGTEAGNTANTALNASKETATAFSNRNNYQVVESQDVLFKSGSANLDAAGKEKLDALAKTIMQDKNLILQLQGFTDSVGGAQANVALSNRRVDAVTRYLVGTAKVDQFRIHSLGLGSTNPVADNHTRDGRAKNRRVTVSVLGAKTQ